MKITKMIGIRSRFTQLAYVDYRLGEYVLGSIFRHLVSLNTYVECSPITKLLSETQYLILDTRVALATKYIERFYEYEDFTESAPAALLSHEEMLDFLKCKKRLRKLKQYREEAYRVCRSCQSKSQRLHDGTFVVEEQYEIATSLQRLEELVVVIDDWCLARNSSDGNGDPIIEIKNYVNQIIEFLTIKNYIEEENA